LPSYEKAADPARVGGSIRCDPRERNAAYLGIAATILERSLLQNQKLSERDSKSWGLTPLWARSHLLPAFVLLKGFLRCKDQQHLDVGHPRLDLFSENCGWCPAGSTFLQIAPFGENVEGLSLCGV
jgi:hypothetical protein